MSVAGPAAWLHVTRGDAPVVLSIPHAGTELPDALVPTLASSWIARKDADWYVDRLYDFAHDLGITVVRTAISRTAIDVNRDPSGASLYPGMTTTGLCPTQTFDGEPLYRSGFEPTPSQIGERRANWFDPYHAHLTAEIRRLRERHPSVVLYDAHSIRSTVPRLFPGELPQFNIGTYGGSSCAPGLTKAVAAVCASTPWSVTINGRFQGGWITRNNGRPDRGIHALQMELAWRGYLNEPPPGPLDATSWPVPYDIDRAAPMRAALKRVLESCIDFAMRPHAPEPSR